LLRSFPCPDVPSQLLTNINRARAESLRSKVRRAQKKLDDSAAAAAAAPGDGDGGDDDDSSRSPSPDRAQHNSKSKRPRPTTTTVAVVGVEAPPPAGGAAWKDEISKRDKTIFELRAKVESKDAEICKLRQRIRELQPPKRLS
jgi:hypothetical protein